MTTAALKGAGGGGGFVGLAFLRGGPSHLVVDPLVDFLLVVQHHKGLGGDGVSVEDEAEVAALALHVGEVRQGRVQPEDTGQRVRDPG